MKKHTLLLLAIAVAAGFIVGTVGRSTGEKTAREDISRLRLIWPRVMEFKDPDRAFVAGLAMTCRLHTKEMDKNEAIACLRSASTDSALVLPKGEDQANAPARLERLLSIANSK